jgi:hypothetical protein
VLGKMRPDKGPPLATRKPARAYRFELCSLDIFESVWVQITPSAGHV